MRQLLRRLLHQDSGEGVAEYALLMALIAICLIGIIQVMRTAIGDSFNTATADASDQAGGGYGSGGGVTAVSGPSYGGGGGGGVVSTPPAEPGDDGEPTPPDSLGLDSLGVSTAHR